jgi:predicted nucleic acid-binding protein
MKYLLDTNVISELVAKQPSAKVIQWIDSIDDTQAYLSVITIGEIKKGIEKLPDSPRKELLRKWLDHDLMARFANRILSIDVDIMLTWGKLTATLERKGRKLPAMDSLVAAVALYGQFTLATRNEDDFKDTGIAIVNPWK